MRLELVIKKLFTDNPDLSRDEAVKRLKEMKDPETGKSLWRSHTIRCQIGTYFNKKGKDDTAFEMEEKVMERHKPKDPFAIEPDGNVEEKAMEIAVSDEQVSKKEIIDDVSKKVPEQVSTDAKPFRDEILTIISDLTSEVKEEFISDKKEISNLKEKVSNLRTQGIPTYEPAIQYNDLRLRRSTIDVIQENTKDRELEDESKYIDILIASYYEPIVKNEDYYESSVEYDDLNLKQPTIDAIQKNTEEKKLKEESEYIDNLIKNEEKYTLKVLKIPS